MDGSCLHRKYQQLVESGANVMHVSPPLLPLTGWESITADSVTEFAKNIPLVTQGRYYDYLDMLLLNFLSRHGVCIHVGRCWQVSRTRSISCTFS